MNRFFRYLYSLYPFRHSKTFNRVHSAEVFASIIERERERTDRTGLGFSLAVFELGGGEGKTDATRILVPILTRKIRATDSIGWLQGGRIGAILPHTSPENSWRFVANILDAYGDDEAAPECTVYAYPSPDLQASGPDLRGKPRLGPTRPFDELDSSPAQQTPAWKRAVDVAGAAAGLVLLSPLLLLVALFIKAVSPGPALFRQERIGHRGKVFTMLKFRTMHLDAETAVHADHLVNLIRNDVRMTKLDSAKDDRIIPFGGLFRATGIDELPQLINILRGDMTLVGPRPCMSYEAREYLPWQMKRFDTPPGLTGLWQVSGKNRTTFKEMIRLDIDYARKRGFLLDMRILLKTVPAVIVQAAGLRASRGIDARRMSPVLRTGALLSAFISMHTLRR